MKEKKTNGNNNNFVLEIFSSFFFQSHQEHFSFIPQFCFGYPAKTAFSYDVTAAILVFRNNETAVMLLFQTNPVGVELFSYLNAFFGSNKSG